MANLNVKLVYCLCVRQSHVLCALQRTKIIIIITSQDICKFITTKNRSTQNHPNRMVINIWMNVHAFVYLQIGKVWHTILSNFWKFQFSVISHQMSLDKINNGNLYTPFMYNVRCTYLSEIHASKNVLSLIMLYTGFTL